MAAIRLFTDTERRSIETAGSFRFMGMGISGGEEGALNGPSLMPGGPDDAYKLIEPMLIDISAKSASGACVTHIGTRRFWPLRQDGPQRDRIWRHAVDRRSLRPHESRAWNDGSGDWRGLRGVESRHVSNRISLRSPRRCWQFRT